MRATQQDFENAMNQVKLLKKDPGNEVKLRLYALYKQATEGPCTMPKPGVFDFDNKAKRDARKVNLMLLTRAQSTWFLSNGYQWSLYSFLKFFFSLLSPRLGLCSQPCLSLPVTGITHMGHLSHCY